MWKTCAVLGCVAVLAFVLIGTTVSCGGGGSSVVIPPTFSPNFLASVVEKSQGFPWVAQAIGYQAVRAALKESRYKLPITVSVRSLDTSIRKLVRPREEDKAFASLRQVLLSRQVSKINILYVLATARERWVHLDDIYNAVPTRQRRFDHPRSGQCGAARGERRARGSRYPVGAVG